jgi:hypothetical protein
MKYVSFNKQSKDVFDAPLVRCDDGNFLLLVPFAAFVNGTYTVLSQLSQRGCLLAWKGENFEKDVRELFRQHQLAASGIKRRINSEEIEIDCVVPWGDYLFVFECKNYSLPSDIPQSEYWFLLDQEDAKRQVQRKVAAIEAHPELIHDCFGNQVSWLRIVPVVLNGVPFSRIKSSDGVCFFDSSALHRFFEDGFIGMAAMHHDLSTPGIVLPEVQRFYPGERPTPEDFVRQLEAPAQVVHGKKLLTRTRRLIEVGDGFQIATVILDRLETIMTNTDGMD